MKELLKIFAIIITLFLFFISCSGSIGGKNGEESSSSLSEESSSTSEEPLDKDTDSIVDEDDNCPEKPNSDQKDTDSDKIGDACDNCPKDSNPYQEDSDSDSIGDICEENPDIDGDGVPNEKDNCKSVENNDQKDTDSDKIGDACDNCPEISNSDQKDTDLDGIGDVCDCLKSTTPDKDYNEDDFGQQIGKVAPNFTLEVANVKDLDEASLWDYYGYIILVVASAGWCEPCKDEAPFLEEMYQKYKKDGFIILMPFFEDAKYNPADSKDALLWATTYHLTFPVMPDPKNIVYGSYSQSIGTDALPLTVVIDRNMKIIDFVEGDATNYLKENLDTIISSFPCGG